MQQSNTSVADKPHLAPASQGVTPLLAAARGGHTATAEALMARGVDVNAKSVSGRGREPWARMGGQAAGQNNVRSKPSLASDAGRGCGIVTEAAGGQARDGRAGLGEGSWLVAVYGRCNSISRGAVRRGGQGRAKRFKIQALI